MWEPNHYCTGFTIITHHFDCGNEELSWLCLNYPFPLFKKFHSVVCLLFRRFGGRIISNLQIRHISFVSSRHLDAQAVFSWSTLPTSHEGFSAESFLQNWCFSLKINFTITSTIDRVIFKELAIVISYWHSAYIVLSRRSHHIVKCGASFVTYR